MNYEPKLPAGQWAEIGSFVRDVVAETYDESSSSVDRLLIAVTAYVSWCHRVAALPLHREVLFTRLQVEDFIVNANRRWSPATKGTVRSMLLRVCEALGDTDASTPLTPFPKSSPLDPYSATEVDRFRFWAASQGTAARRHSTKVLVALGFGAGLSAGEIGRVRSDDVIIDEAGMLVSVDGGHRGGRAVPLLAEWENLLAEVLANLDSGRLLFRPERTRYSKNVVTEFVAKNSDITPRLQSQRMRSTWIVAHLIAETPLHALMAAAGVRELEAIGRYIDYVPLPEPSAARAALRFASTQNGGDR
jgi:hypothetical protein